MRRILLSLSAVCLLAAPALSQSGRHAPQETSPARPDALDHQGVTATVRVEIFDGMKVTARREFKYVLTFAPDGRAESDTPVVAAFKLGGVRLAHFDRVVLADPRRSLDGGDAEEGMSPIPAVVVRDPVTGLPARKEGSVTVVSGRRELEVRLTVVYTEWRRVTVKILEEGEPGEPLP